MRGYDAGRTNEAGAVDESSQKRFTPGLRDRTENVTSCPQAKAIECGGWDSNPHVPKGTIGFEPIASAVAPPPR
jgi:hypothetical protein